MEKTVLLRNTEITFSIWDLGGQREFLSMLPLVCNDAVAIFFMFDLSRKVTLMSVKEWYRQARGLNRVCVYVYMTTSIIMMRIFSFARLSKNVLTFAYCSCFMLLDTQSAHAFLVGTKYDIYTTLPPEEIDEIDKLARKYEKAMKAPLIFSSA
jgi:GTP-binding protein of the ras superfamily involved in termination of M-phase